VRPHRFDLVEDLGTYSYVENKVFPLDNARISRIAKPLLRKIAQYTFKGNNRSKLRKRDNVHTTDDGLGKEHRLDSDGDTVGNIAMPPRKKGELRRSAQLTSLLNLPLSRLQLNFARSICWNYLHC
jgi:hypothetical protein